MFLLVGHTHDFLDTVFAFVSAALRHRDHLNMAELFGILQDVMRNPPHWQHLRDVYAWREWQPAWLSSAHVQGIGTPHHYRVCKCRDGSISLQCKRWLTDAEWSPPQTLCTSEQVEELRNMWPEQIEAAFKKAS